MQVKSKNQRVNLTEQDKTEWLVESPLSLFSYYLLIIILLINKLINNKNNNNNIYNINIIYLFLLVKLCLFVPQKTSWGWQTSAPAV